MNPHSRLSATLVASLGTALLGAPSASARPATKTEVTKPAPRLVLAYFNHAKLGIFDLRTGRRTGSVALPGTARASLAPVGDRRHVVAVQYDGDQVRVLDGGSWTVPHGDHTHSYVAAPRLTPFALAGPQPSHVVTHDGTVAIHFDGTARTSMFAAGDLARASQPRRTFTTGKAHHGVAVPFGPITLASTAAATPDLAADGLPGEISVRDAAGNETGRLAPCPELHGEAAGDGWAAFGCADGILLATVSGTRVTSRKLAYPAGTTAGVRTFTLKATAGGRHLVGDLGPDALVRVDRVAGAVGTIGLPASRGAFTVDGPDVLALAGDGRLREVNVATGRHVRTVRAIRAYDASAPFSTPRPQIAVGAGRVIVAEPATKTVHVLSARNLKRLRTIKPRLVPGPIAVTGDGAP